MQTALGSDPADETELHALRRDAQSGDGVVRVFGAEAQHSPQVGVLTAQPGAPGQLVGSDP
ncbi:hypothetical protein [Amycolatopsis australiensis]|uniref:hypothetical protein n=1 Tax=Amycolatopsis australiensis TaxID=546364 RepID=UPI001160F358|nr:hypothetical protein [Amycolatopsis australiensis]